MQIKGKKKILVKPYPLYEFTLVCGTCGFIHISAPLPEKAELQLLSRKCDRCEATAKLLEKVAPAPKVKIKEVIKELKKHIPAPAPKLQPKAKKKARK